MSEELREQAERLRLQAGDVVVVTVPNDVPETYMHRVKNVVVDVVPEGVKVLVVSSGVTVRRLPTADKEQLRAWFDAAKPAVDGAL